jgi:hypothetical protein
VTRHLWGDDAAGRVDDWIYTSSGKIHQLVVGLPSGRAFRHSESYRTVFGADEVLYVLAGDFVCANPATGEVKRAARGEAIFFRKDTWHHGFSVGTAPLRVLEFFAPRPPPAPPAPMPGPGPMSPTSAAMAAMPWAAGRWRARRSRRATA